MIKKYFQYTIYFLFLVNCVFSQNPTNINLNSVPTNYAVDSYTRATTKINLLPGFKFEPTTNNSNKLLNLSIGTYPTYVNNSYIDTLLSNINYVSNSNLECATTEGNGIVNPNGSFNYQISLVSSPGIAAMQPNLGVIYNSNAGYSSLGLGFSLSGISAITRTNKTKYFDGINSEIKLNNTDVFAIDGEYLFLKSGTYGQNGAVYKTEIESYNKIISIGGTGSGPQSFVVYTSDGKIIEYGNTSNSKLTGNSNNEILAWYINKVTDEFGNYMVFNYTTSNNEISIASIEYSGNINEGLLPYNKVEFDYYDNIPDSKIIYIAGSAFKQTRLLKSITSKSSSGQFVRKYLFNYQYSNMSLLHSITEIDANGNQLNPTYFDWNKITSNSNIYNVPSNITFANQVSNNLNFSDNITTIAADLNGDGKKDLITLNCQQITTNTPLPTTYNVFLSTYNILPLPYNDFIEVTNNSLFNTKQLAPNFIEVLGISVFDEDDDNREEIFITSRTPNTNFYFIQKLKFNGSSYNLSLYQNLTPISVSNPSNPFVANWRNSSINVSSNLEVSRLARSGYFLGKADFNGDNELDVVSIDQNYIKINIFGNSTPVTYSINDVIKCKLGDFNGDGKADIFLLKATSLPCFGSFNVLNSSEVSVLSYNSSSGNLNFVTSKIINNGVIGNIINCSNSDLALFFENVSNNIDFGDFNGDGKTDIIFNNFLSPFVQTNNPGTAELKVAFSNGVNFVSEVLINTVSTKIASHNAAFFASDMNDDGMCDWASSAFDATLFKTFYSYYPSNGKIIHPNPILYSRNLKFGGCLGDFDGDGTQDFVGQNSLGSNVTIGYNVFQHNCKRLVNKIKNIKTTLVVDYSLLVDKKSNTNYPIYRKTNSSYSNSFTNVKLPLFVAISTKYNNIETQYAYENSLVHKGGKGFLGFEKVYTSKVNENMISISSFTYNDQQDFPSITETIIGIKAPTSITFPVIYSFPAINTANIIAKNKTDYTFVLNGKTRYLAITLNNQKDYLKSTNSYISNVYDNNKDGNILSTSTYNSNWANTSTLNGITTTPIYVGVTNPFSGKIIYKPNQILVSKVADLSGSFTGSQFITDLTYDAAGHLINKIENSNIPSNAITTTYNNFNNFGSPQNITVSAPDLTLPRTNQFVYDNTGRFVIKVINSLGNFEEAIYETKYGNKIQSKDITGLISTFNYDGLGRLIKTTTSNNAVNSLKYEWHSYTLPSNTNTYFGSMVTTKVEGSPTLIKKYDINELLQETNIQAFGGASSIVNYTYNNNNQLINQTELASINPLSGNKILLNTYDIYLRPLTTTQKIGNNILNTIDYSYNNLSTDITYNKGFVQVKAPNSSNGQFYFVKKENDEAGRNDKTLNFTNLPSTTQTSETKFNQYGLPYQISNSFNGSTGNNIQINYDALGRQQQLIDPSSGTSSYVYNSIGELLQQTTPNGTYNFTYDILGRLITKTSGSNNYSYQYVNSGNGKEQLQKVIGPNEITEYSFDNLNRVTEKKQTLTTANNKILKSNYTYDKYGNMLNYTYPSGFTIQNEYDNIGNLIKIKNNNTVIWELDNLYTPELISQYKTNNGLFTNTISYDQYQNLQQKTFGSLLQQNYSISQKNGDVLNRDLNQLASTNEQFTYDEFNRLNTTKYYNSSNNQQLKASVSYFQNGNINNKSDAGDYVYGSATNPYQLTSINNSVGNISTNQLNITYNDFNKVKQISEASTTKQFDFTYGNDEQRVKMEYSIAGLNQYTRFYSDNYDLQENSDATYKEWSYIYAPTGLAAIYYSNNGTNQLIYTETDHLGSPLLVANTSGAIIEQYSFDAWGRRRNPTDWNDYTTGITSNYMIRGYTGHEHLDEVGIINMNGRIYDPVLGRFLQADNYVQAPDNLQNFNRYGYCLNNPLKYTDPSGNYAIIDDVLAAVIGGVVNLAMNWQYLDNGGGFWSTLGRGASAFGAGAAAGWGAIYPEFGGWFWGGAIVGATNNWLMQTSVPGNEFDYGSLVQSTAFGVMGSVAGGMVGAAVSPLISTALSGVANPVLASTLGGAVSGGLVGSVTGFALTYMATGDIKQAMYSAKVGGITGFITGGVSGFASAKAHQLANKKPPLEPEYLDRKDVSLPKNDADYEVVSDGAQPKINSSNNKIDTKLQVDRIDQQGWKKNMEITNMTQAEVMSKLTDLTFYKSTSKSTVYKTPDGSFVTVYPSSDYKGGKVPTIMYNNNKGNIIHLRFLTK